MRACIARAHGGPEVLEVRDVPEPPDPGPGQVLVRVVAASVNPVDYKLRRAPSPIGPVLPAILGCDAAGVIERVGAEVVDFQPGDAVYGCVGGVRGLPGTYAEYVLADARLIARKPEALDFRQAAALPLVTITAAEGLARAGVGGDSRLLVRGGAGGVGHVVVQLARAMGAHVTATVSAPAKAAEALRLGAQVAIACADPASEDIVATHAQGEGFDVVYDATGGSDLPGSLALARPGGQVVTIVSMYSADLTLAHLRGLSIHVVFMLLPMLLDRGREAHGDILRRAAALADAGLLRPLVDPRRFGLADVARAHATLEAREALGKLIIDVAP